MGLTFDRAFSKRCAALIIGMTMWMPPCAMAQDVGTSEESKEREQDRVCAQSKTHELLNGTLWVQTSPEYRMATSQAYLLASIMVERALANPNWTAAPEQETVDGYQLLDPAVIVDVDETILSNARFEGRLIAEGTKYESPLWTLWEKEKKAEAIDGAKAFVKRLGQLGVKIFYVTNREHESDAYTGENLRIQGFPVTTEGEPNLLSKKGPAWGSNKTTRRAYLAQRYRILLLIGDDLNDFVSGARKDGAESVTPQSRNDVADRHRNYWGSKWIVIPNPMYGYWEQAFYNFNTKLKRCEVVKQMLRAVQSFP